MVNNHDNKLNTRSAVKKYSISKVNSIINADLLAVKPIIMFTGFIDHVHISFFDFINKICTDYSIETIPVVVHTWDIELNNDALHRFREYCKKYKNIDLHVITDRFDSKDFFSFIEEIPFVSIHRNLDIKWVSKFFAIHRLSNYINKEFSNSTIIKVTNRIKFNVSFESFLLLLSDNEDLWKYNIINSNVNFKDEFIFGDFSYNYFNEQQFVASSNLLYKIFGGTLPHFRVKFKKAVLRLSKEYGVMKLDFDKIMNYKLYPEGGEVFYRLIHNFNPFLYTFRYNISIWTTLLGRGKEKIPSYPVRIDGNNTQYIRKDSSVKVNLKLKSDSFV